MGVEEKEEKRKRKKQVSQKNHIPLDDFYNINERRGLLYAFRV